MSNRINEIIIRVLSGNATTEESKELLRWLKESDDNAKDFAENEMLWNALEIIGKKHEFDPNTGFQDFSSRINSKKSKSKISPIYSWIRVAAMVILASGIAFWAGRKLSPANHTNAMSTIVAPKGSKAFTELPDGTKVWLNAESKLSYAATFSVDSRHVYLEGESYFEVAKDAKRPFIVHTSGVNIRALGTAFNVKSYPSEDIVQTTLVEGEVVIEKQKSRSINGRSAHKMVYLKPNQQATFYKSTSLIDVHSKTSVVKKADQKKGSGSYATMKKDTLFLADKVNPVLFTSWKEDKLIFENEPLESMSVKLERRFNMNFIFMDESVKSFRFTGKFNEISVEQLLAALQYASPFYYIIHENDIYISLKPIQKSNQTYYND